MAMKVYGLRPYLRKDGEAVGHEWRISADFDSRLSEVLERVVNLAMQSAGRRGMQTLHAIDLDRADLALRVAEQVSKIDPGIPRSTSAPGGPMGLSTTNPHPNPQTADIEKAIP
jgi:hypothetical protein